MKKILSPLISPLGLCAIGAMITLGGEMWGAAFDGDKPGGTISEWFKALPHWIQLAIFFIIGWVCCHLAEWRIRDPEPITIQAETIQKMEIKEPKSK